MAGIRFFRLINRFVETLERLGATVIRNQEKDDNRPASLRVISSDGTTDCIVFLWTITTGGGGEGVRSPTERRIQITRVSGVPLQPGRRTLLGGWSEEFGVFAFWDPRRHIRFSSNSPSLQVPSTTLEYAHTFGISTCLRPTAQGDEVVVAVDPDSLLWYVQHGLPLHNSQDDATSVSELIEPTPEIERSFLDNASDEIAASRRYDLVETMRAYRESRFRPAVLRAYRNQCAVCGCALKLVDAAHIIPVSHPRSTDVVTNGLALCRLHHGAYDNALLGVQSNYHIVVNPAAERRLVDLGLHMGLEAFKSTLPKMITLPNVSDVRPDPMNLRVALEARLWPKDIIIY